MSNRKKTAPKYAAQEPSGTTTTAALPLVVPIGVALIIIAAFIAYFPSLGGGFIWDDETLITDNKIIKSSNGLFSIWCTTEPYDYWPMTNSSFWIEWRLWEMHPTGYHITNLLLHTAASLLIWIVLRKLSIPGAFLAALIFAVHPVNVESVAWIAQRKNTLSIVFFLLSILWYLKFQERACRSLATRQIPSSTHCQPTFSSFILHPLSFHAWYWLSLFSFILGMLSKGSVAVLPVLLLGIIWWQRKITWRDFVRTAPFFAVAVALTAVNVWFQSRGEETIRIAGFAERMLGAGTVVWFYLYKALLPLNLTFVYPNWQIQASNPLWWLPLLAALAVTAVLWLYRDKWGRPCLFSWGFCCVALAPVMGLSDVYFMKYSLVADHYQYIAIIGVISLLAAGWDAWHKHRQKTARLWATSIAAVLTCTLMFFTWRQSTLYNDAITMYRDTLEKNPQCWMIHNNLGPELIKAGRAKEAIDHYNKLLLVKPDLAEAHNNLGSALFITGFPQKAIEHYRQAIHFKPDYAEAYYNLGNALKTAGKPQSSIEQYEMAIHFKPKYIEAINNLGNTLLALGQNQQAVEQYEKLLKLDPESLKAHNNLGLALVQTGRIDEAIEHYKYILAHNPAYFEAYFNLALAHAKAGSRSDAVAAAEKALELARSAGQTNSASQIEEWLNAYKTIQSNLPRKSDNNRHPSE